MADIASALRLRVDLAAVKANYRLTKSKTAATVAGVVKADGYGLGMQQVAGALREENCPLFFVATLGEAAHLRASDPRTPIATLGGLYPGAEDDYRAHAITPILNSLEEIERWRALARARGQALPAILHFDTGMNRLGLSADEARTIFEDSALLDGLDVTAVMSHFACSDVKDHPMNAQQAALFGDIARHFPKAKKSLANSSGIWRDPAWHHDLVRPGYSLYGGNPLPEQKNPMAPAVRLDTQVLQVRDVAAGQSIGYGATHVFDKHTSTATVALGYADGFPRAAGACSSLYWNGAACPIVGRVSMDLVTVETGHLERPPRPGEWLEVIGPHQGIDALAEGRSTIGYEILTSLSRRAGRQYLT